MPLRPWFHRHILRISMTLDFIVTRPLSEEISFGVHWRSAGIVASRGRQIYRLSGIVSNGLRRRTNLGLTISVLLEVKTLNLKFPINFIGYLDLMVFDLKITFTFFKVILHGLSGCIYRRCFIFTIFEKIIFQF